MHPAAFPALIALGALALLVLAGAAPGEEPFPGVVSDTSELTPSVRLPSTGQQVVLPASPQPFRAGEMLKFSVQYGPIHAGTAYLEVPEVRDWQGHPVYHLLARAESNHFFDKVYRVRNRIDSYWDTTGRFSRRYTEDRHEGHHHFHDDIVFDHDRQEARYDNGQTFPIPPQAQDALSSFYYTRFQPLPLGGSIVFDYHADKKSAPLQVRILGRDRVETPAGKFNCVAIEPVLNAGGIFKNTGRLVIWITDDERRMPVLMKSKVTIGSISVILVDARPGA
ncbi:MAG TPA: DUF3108 domain-containing protein [Gaiellales bacterium]|nr:DUF3108 domain-containing protein [Gaiellales bacterium]